jgi:hypothetical protein
MLVHKPPHNEWPAAVKWYALWDLARSTRWHPWVHEQQFWEGLVCPIVNGSRAGFNRPNRFALSTSAPIEICLPVVIPIAQAWRAANTPFTREPFQLPKSA